MRGALRHDTPYCRLNPAQEISAVGRHVGRAITQAKGIRLVSSEEGSDVRVMGFDEWQTLLRSFVELAPHVEKNNRRTFSGSGRLLSVHGLPAFDGTAANISRLERTARDVRLDGRDHYAVVLPLAGATAFSQNERVVELAPSDLLLVDATRPFDYFPRGGLRLLFFRVPRRMVISNLGFEPQGGLSSSGTLAGRLILQLAAEIAEGEASSSAHSHIHMQLAICDLLGVLFARPDGDLERSSRHAERLFTRVCSIVKDDFVDPDLTPSAVAAAAGISLRYLQKLFTPRGTTCGQFIHTMRLDHAARLLQRRAVCITKLSLSDIAFEAGFRDYKFFSRKFRQRFGCGPSEYAQSDQRNA
jgi:AraC family transcriptional regulator, positive regulator of tynA and feaB